MKNLKVFSAMFTGVCVMTISITLVLCGVWIRYCIVSDILDESAPLVGIGYASVCENEKQIDDVRKLLSKQILDAHIETFAGRVLDAANEKRTFYNKVRTSFEKQIEAKERPRSATKSVECHVLRELE